MIGEHWDCPARCTVLQKDQHLMICPSWDCMTSPVKKNKNLPLIQYLSTSSRQLTVSRLLGGQP